MNCQLARDVTTPDGYAYALRRVDVKHTADLPRGATAGIVAELLLRR
jgi:hypothetical protein